MDTEAKRVATEVMLSHSFNYEPLKSVRVKKLKQRYGTSGTNNAI